MRFTHWLPIIIAGGGHVKIRCIYLRHLFFYALLSFLLPSLFFSSFSLFTFLVLLPSRFTFFAFHFSLVAVPLFVFLYLILFIFYFPLFVSRIQITYLPFSLRLLYSTASFSNCFTLLVSLPA